jgi:predicted kinase
VKLSRDRVVELIRSLQSLAPGYISFDGVIVTLEMSVEKVKAEIARHHRQIPEEVLRRSYLLPFLGESVTEDPSGDPATTKAARRP